MRPPSSIEYAKQCMNMRSGNARYSADPGVGRRWPWRGRTQIIRFGAASGGRLGNQVAEQIGGSECACIWVPFTFGDRLAESASRYGTCDPLSEEFHCRAGWVVAALLVPEG